jgi:hypothetical protein
MKKIPTWLKLFAGLYATMAITNTFMTTRPIGDLIGIILGLWIAGWCVCKVFGGMFTLPSLPVPIRRNSNSSNHLPPSYYDEQRKREEERIAKRNAEEAKERADAAYREAEHAAWKANQGS